MTTKQDIYNQVRDILIKHLNVTEDQVQPDSDLVSNLGADILDCVEIIMEMEEHFNIAIPETDTANLFTTEQLSNYVCRRLGIK